MLKNELKYNNIKMAAVDDKKNDIDFKIYKNSEIQKIYINLLVVRGNCKIVLTKINSSIPEETHRFQPCMFD